MLIKNTSKENLKRILKKVNMKTKIKQKVDPEPKTKPKSGPQKIGQVAIPDSGNYKIKVNVGFVDVQLKKGQVIEIWKV